MADNMILMELTETGDNQRFCYHWRRRTIPSNGISITVIDRYLLALGLAGFSAACVPTIKACSICKSRE